MEREARAARVQGWDELMSGSQRTVLFQRARARSLASLKLAVRVSEAAAVPTAAMLAYIRSEAPRLRSGALLGALLVLLILLLPFFPILWPFLRACHRWTLRGPNGGERRRSRGTRPAGGQLLRLSYGETFVKLEGPPASEAPIIVLIHGNTGSMRCLDELAACLTSAGRRVLRYDLYGRGWSTCAGWPHTWQLFVGQLAEVLLALQISGPVDLVGYSIGAQVAGCFAAVHTARVRSLVLLCPAIITKAPWWLPTLLQFPPARALFGHFVVSSLFDRAGYAADWVHLDDADEARRSASRARLAALHADEQERMIEEPHLARAIGLTISSMPFTECRAQWEHLRSKVVVHAICAGLDKIAPGAANAEWLRELLGVGTPAAARVRLLADEGHSIPAECPDRCAAILLEALGSDVRISGKPSDAERRRRVSPAKKNRA